VLAVAACLAVLPARAEKPAASLDRPTSVTIAVSPIDFDRDNPARKEFGKLIFRAGFNLYAKSAHFGGFSGLVVDASGRSLLAVTDAGTWLRATLDYDGRKLKGLDDAVLGPILGADGKPIRDDALRDSEGMTLADGDTDKTVLSFEGSTGSHAIPSTGAARPASHDPPPSGLTRRWRQSRHRGDHGYQSRS
jgi:hypothetical protein